MSSRPHPLQSWADRHRLAALILAIAALAVPTALLLALQPLHEDTTAGGIVDLELAGSVERTEEIVDSWRDEGVLEEATFLHGLDFLYPLIYAGALAAGSLAAAGLWRRAGRPRLAGWGTPVAWVATAAAGFDYVENVALATALLGDPAAPWPQIAYAAAALKFACIAVPFAYVLAGCFGGLAGRPPATASERP